MNKLGRRSQAASKQNLCGTESSRRGVTQHHGYFAAGASGVDGRTARAGRGNVNESRAKVPSPQGVASGGVVRGRRRAEVTCLAQRTNAVTEVLFTSEEFEMVHRNGNKEETIDNKTGARKGVSKKFKLRAFRNWLMRFFNMREYSKYKFVAKTRRQENVSRLLRRELKNFDGKKNNLDIEESLLQLRRLQSPNFDHYSPQERKNDYHRLMQLYAKVFSIMTLEGVVAEIVKGFSSRDIARIFTHLPAGFVAQIISCIKARTDEEADYYKKLVDDAFVAMPVRSIANLLGLLDLKFAIKISCGDFPQNIATTTDMSILSQKIADLIRNNVQHFKQNTNDLLQLAAAVYRINNWGATTARTDIIKKLYSYGFNGKHIAFILAEESTIKMVPSGIKPTTDSKPDPMLDVLRDLKDCGVSPLDIVAGLKMSTTDLPALKQDAELIADARKLRMALDGMNKKLPVWHQTVFNKGTTYNPNARTVGKQYQIDVARSHLVFFGDKPLRDVAEAVRSSFFIAEGFVPREGAAITKATDMLKIVVMDQNIRSICIGAIIRSLSDIEFTYSSGAENVTYHFNIIAESEKSITVQITMRGQDGGVIEGQLMFSCEELRKMAAANFDQSYHSCVLSATVSSAYGLRCRYTEDMEREPVILPELISETLYAGRAST